MVVLPLLEEVGEVAVVLQQQQQLSFWVALSRCCRGTVGLTRKLVRVTTD